MAKLVLSANGNLVNQYFLDQPLLRIGRGADNEIIIDDAEVREHHASIRCVGDDHILSAEGDADDLSINGRPTGRRILQHLDTLQFGRHHLRYMNTRVAKNNDLDLTMNVRTLGKNGDPAATIAELPNARGNKVRFPAGHVRVLRRHPAMAAGRTVVLDRVITTFGTPGLELIVLTRRPQGFSLSHVEGATRPRINRRPISEQATPLSDGDVIEGAGWLLEFRLGAPAEGEPA
jgi:predicted component of type VI protein secretion system